MSLYAYQPRFVDDMMDMMDEFSSLHHPLSLLDTRPPAVVRDRRPHQLMSLASLCRDVEVHNTDKEYRVNLDLQHYSPEEVKITSDDERITVNAKHEEKQDNHGFVSREVTRVFTLPQNSDPKSITSSMNGRGRLAIRVQKKAIEAPKETSIPVEYNKN